MMLVMTVVVMMMIMACAIMGGYSTGRMQSNRLWRHERKQRIFRKRNVLPLTTASTSLTPTMELGLAYVIMATNKQTIS